MESPTNKALWRPWMTMNYSDTASNEAINTCYTSHYVRLAKTRVISSSTCTGSVYSSPTTDLSLFNWSQCSTRNLNEAVNASCDVRLTETHGQDSNSPSSPSSLCSGNEQSVYSSPTSNLGLFHWPSQYSARNVSSSPYTDTSDIQCPTPIKRQRSTAFHTSLQSTSNHSSKISCADLAATTSNTLCLTSNADLTTVNSNNLCLTSTTRADLTTATSNNLCLTSSADLTTATSSLFPTSNNVDTIAANSYNLSPTSTTSADLIKACSNNLSGTFTTSGDLTATNSYNLSPTSTTSADLIKAWSNNLSGTFTTSGDLTATNSYNLSPTSTTIGDLTATNSYNLSPASTTSGDHAAATNSNNLPPTSSADLAVDLSRFTTWLETKLQQIREVNELSQFLEADSLNGPSEFKMKISLSKDLPMPNAEWIYCDENGLELALNPNTSLLFEHLYDTSSELDSTVQMLLPEMGREYEISLKGMVMTDVHTREKIALFRRTWRREIIQQPTTRSGPDEFPPQWSPQENDIQLVRLNTTTAEFAAVQTIFLGTLPSRCILQIERVQNKKLYIRYAFQKALLLDKYSGNEQRLNEKMLFHGTKRTLPKKIWQSEDGFDLRYGRRGMWGVGTYFAENASYSDDFAHKKKGEFNEMFLANVLTGNSIEMISTRMTRLLTRPPVCVEATATKSEVLYDSVMGFAGGSRIYVLYKLDMAYPSYLVRYI